MWTFWRVTADGPDGPVSFPHLDEGEARKHASLLWADEAYTNIRVSPVEV